MNRINFQDYRIISSNNAVTFSRRETDGHIMLMPHWHPHYEIMLITEGHYTVICNGQSIRSDKPGAYLFMPHALHQITADTRFRYKRCQITLSNDLVHRLEGDILDIRPYADAQLLYAQPDAEGLSAMLDTVRDLEQYTGDIGLKTLNACILFRHILNAVSCGQGSALHGTHTYIQEILEYVVENLSSPPTVAALAEKCDVCQAKFYRDFKETMGITYKRYLTTIRQNNARLMLNRGESIIRTSLECGYCSEAHFIKAFREYWGMTPGEFIHQTKEQR